MLNDRIQTNTGLSNMKRKLRIEFLNRIEQFNSIRTNTNRGRSEKNEGYSLKERGREDLSSTNININVICIRLKGMQYIRIIPMLEEFIQYMQSKSYKH